MKINRELSWTYDASGNLVSLEILDASRRIKSPKQIDYDDAVELFNQKRFNSSASRAYYASYQAMWSALGDPKDGESWRHLAIIKHFVRGYRFESNHPKTGPGLLEDKRDCL
ncbi:MAG: hypothetical protein AB1611_00360 [bacterium]